MLKFHAILAIGPVTGLALSACAASPTEPLRSADTAANTQCRTTLNADGGRIMDCTLWERTTTTTTTTTTTGSNGESRTTVERTQTGGDA